MKKYNSNIHHRRSIRLKGYDYSQPGLYFVTICAKNRECLFGHIANHIMILNEAGKLIENEWVKLSKRFQNIQLHEFIVMPNHFHAILEIVGETLVVAPNNMVAPNNAVAQKIDSHLIPTNKQSHLIKKKGQPQGIAPTNSTLGDMVGAFESITTVEYIRGVKNNNWQPFDGKLWQRNYWEHIIRNDNEYNRIAHYIVNNPTKWKNDSLNGDSDKM